MPPEESPKHRNQFDVPSPHSFALENNDAENCHQEKEPTAKDHPQEGIAYSYGREPEAGAQPDDNPWQGDGIRDDRMGQIDAGDDQQSRGEECKHDSLHREMVLMV